MATAWPRLLRLLGRAVRNFLNDGCMDSSATVAFYSLLSIGPLLYFVGAALHLVFGIGDGLQLALDRLTAFLPPEVAERAGQLTPGLRTDARVVLLALPALLWMGTTVFSSLEGAINVVFGTAGRGSVWRSRVTAFAILGIGCAVMVVSLLFQTAVSLLAEHGSALFSMKEPTRFTELLSYVTLIVASFLTFVIFFRWLPRTRVGWRAALAGAALSLVLWEGSRRLFGGILVHSPTFGVITGALAGVVAFLLWIYTAVAIFLLGAELAALVNGNRSLGSG
jgi:YihY family inner membrane protein